MTVHLTDARHPLIIPHFRFLSDWSARNPLALDIIVIIHLPSGMSASSIYAQPLRTACLEQRHLSVHFSDLAHFSNWERPWLVSFYSFYLHYSFSANIL